MTLMEGKNASLNKCLTWYVLLSFMQPHLTQLGTPVSSTSSECDWNIGHSFLVLAIFLLQKHKVHFGAKICNEYTHINIQSQQKQNNKHMQEHKSHEIAHSSAFRICLPI